MKRKYIGKLWKYIQIFLFLISYSIFSKAQTNNLFETDFVIEKPVSEQDFPIILDNGSASAIKYDTSDYPGVIRAIHDLQNDIESVTGKRPDLRNSNESAEYEIIIGTLGKSKRIAKLIASKKLDATSIDGKWESFVIATIPNPNKKTKNSLVIVGSDKRGTIYGIYELSKQLGVSPWYWWADVPAKKRTSAYVRSGRYASGEPKVKYRGIFINNEAPAFSGWATEKFGGANSKVYTKVFELILRLKGNYLWPAMWGNAFNDDDPLNRTLADEYGIVMGTSHHEPMDRSQQEWKRYGKGEWNYIHNSEGLREFWRQGIENMGNAESLITMGMRGDGDMPMGDSTNIALLEKIIHDQREILTEVTGKKPQDIPQLWALYTEVQRYYDQGMRVPDDITILFSDDNFGNIRRLPDVNLPKRVGGYGVYYHYDFNGGPWSHKWINTVQITKVWEQLHLAYEHGIDRIWVLNVGDIKPLEFPTNFYFDYAWNPDNWPSDKLEEYAVQWAQEQLGGKYAEQIGEVMTRYSNYNGFRKPELMLLFNRFSLTDYREFETIVANYNALRDDAEEINKLIPAAYKDAYFETVLHPIQAVSNLYELFYALSRNKMYAGQGRATTNTMADLVKEYYVKDSLLSHYYNHELVQGKWNHMMDQTHVNYTAWRGPDIESIPETKRLDLKKEADMGIAIEGSSAWWPNNSAEAVLPTFNSYRDTAFYIEIFNQGTISFDYLVQADVPWVIASSISGSIAEQERVWVTIDWNKAPKGTQEAHLTISGAANQKVSVKVPIDNTETIETLAGKGFVESNGYVSINAVNYSKAILKEGYSWHRLDNYGKIGSGITLFPATMPKQEATESAPHLEYKVFLKDTGAVNIQVYLGSTIDYSGGKGLHYAIAFDGQTPQIINSTLQKPGEFWVNDNHDKVMMDDVRVDESVHKISKPGEHTIKFWIIDKGLILQKIVVDCGGVKSSELGPPESYNSLK
ncbi:MAG: glycosyl hydrolase 115 family protein [Bacteroidales bacterium]|nr:glycosyl hydrolase 115 family protein [Bacteroidales bacterium]MBN2820932.1 glycosyl hydrolase 115 family protein [Bacteroidales bacterium]